MDDQQDKSHEATPHRRQQAREKGQIARSQDLGNSLLLLASLLVLYAWIVPLSDFCGGLVRTRLSTVTLSATTDDVMQTWWAILLPLGMALVPVLLLIAAAAAGVNLMQGGILWLPDKLAPDISRIDPWQGLQRILSWQGAARLAFGLLKIGIIGVVGAIAIRSEQEKILALAVTSVPQIAIYLLEVSFWVTLKIAIALVILAILDYGFQWWRQEQDLRMSHQEMRDELKQLQGDPQIAARRRQVQRQLVMHRLKQAIPKADVVITNPTELAIAIQYDVATMVAPIVVAKGAGLLAQQIRRLALEQGIPIVERKPLAQALYRDVDVNQPIPAQLYAAVAEVLAYVYQLQGRSTPKLGST